MFYYASPEPQVCEVDSPAILYGDSITLRCIEIVLCKYTQPQSVDDYLWVLDKTGDIVTHCYYFFINKTLFLFLTFVILYYPLPTISRIKHIFLYHRGLSCLTTLKNIPMTSPRLVRAAMAAN